MLKKIIMGTLIMLPLAPLVAAEPSIESDNVRITMQIQSLNDSYTKTLNGSSLIFDALIPLSADNQQINFVDAQIGYFNKLFQTYSLGFGHREASVDKVYGVYGFYDYQRALSGRYYHRVNIGMELLAEEWSLRSNFYLYPGENTHKIRDISRTATTIVSLYEQVYSGTDVVLGHNLGIENFNAYIGYYNFGGTIKGNKLRLEYQVNERVAFNASVQHDTHRGTLTRAGISVFMGQAISPTNSLAQRLRAPIIRDLTVAARQYLETATLVAKIAENESSVHDNPAVNSEEDTNEFVEKTPEENTEEVVNVIPETPVEEVIEEIGDKYCAYMVRTRIPGIDGKPDTTGPLKIYNCEFYDESYGEILGTIDTPPRSWLY
jgi:hypothetical protein